MAVRRKKPKWSSIDKEWANHLIGLRMKVDASWWPGYKDEEEPIPGAIVGLDFKDEAGKFFQFQIDGETHTYSMRYDAVLHYADEESRRFHVYHLPSDQLPDPEDEEITLADLQRRSSSYLPRKRALPCKKTVSSSAATAKKNTPEPSTSDEEEDETLAQLQSKKQAVRQRLVSNPQESDAEFSNRNDAFEDDDDVSYGDNNDGEDEDYNDSDKENVPPSQQEGSDEDSSEMYQKGSLMGNQMERRYLQLLTKPTLQSFTAGPIQRIGKRSVALLSRGILSPFHLQERIRSLLLKFQRRSLHLSKMPVVR